MPPKRELSGDGAMTLDFSIIPADEPRSLAKEKEVFLLTNERGIGACGRWPPPSNVRSKFLHIAHIRDTASYVSHLARPAQTGLFFANITASLVATSTLLVTRNAP